MKFIKIFKAMELIDSYHSNGTGYNVDIILFTGLGALSEIRAKARSQITKDNYGNEFFRAAKIKLEPNKGAEYMAVAYYDRNLNAYLYVREIQEEEV